MTHTILKFGGSSLGTPERILSVVDIVKRARPRAIVVSAFEGATNTLLELGTAASRGEESYRAAFDLFAARHFDAVRNLLAGGAQSQASLEVKLFLNTLQELVDGVFRVRELSRRTADSLMSFGELLSATICAHVLTAKGIEAEMCDARTLVVTNDEFGNASVDRSVTDQKIATHFASRTRLQVVPGFIAATSKGETTRLGRGGSDYTAALFGVALRADEIEIWADVNGLMTCDPRKVPAAFSLDEVTFDEAMELSHFGAKVLYPPTMQPARDAGISIRVRNSFQPEFAGTKISENARSHGRPITGISSIPRAVLLRLEGSGLVGVAGISARLFGALSRAKVNVILISHASSEHSICFAISPDDESAAIRAIREEFRAELALHLVDDVSVEKDLSIVSIIGEGMRKMPGISGRLFSALGRNGVNVVAIAQGSSELNISTVIPAVDERKALSSLHESFFLSEQTSVHLFLIGTGNVGRVLLEQIAGQQEHLLRENALSVQLCGLSDSKSMLLSRDGLSAAEWKVALEGSGTKSDAANFVSQMIDLNLSNSVFVDCTASDAVASLYERVLDASISVVTANKRAQSGPQEQFDKLSHTARRRGVSFLFEASVGAGLPIIGTLNDLMLSGDEIVQTEAILSGTLSFVCNNLSPERPLSAVLREAHALGLTEPDPREDLSGLDIVRKLVILSRVAGMKVEQSEVALSPLVPDELLRPGPLDDFWRKLAEYDTEFNKIVNASAARSEKLRFVASIAKGRAEVSLQSVNADHPFFHLSGGDNIFVFRTRRYEQRPLVVQGPGAGAAVTAAAVFSDAIRAGRLARLC